MDSGPQKLNTLLSRYQSRFRPPQKTVITTFLSVVERECGIPLLKKDVTYSPSNRILGVSGLPSPVRTEILLKKELILDECKKELGEKHCPKAMV